MNSKAMNPIPFDTQPQAVTAWEKVSMSTPELYDGFIYGVEERVNHDGQRYNKILFYGKHPERDELVQWTTRAVYYVERYGWDKAKANAQAYDPNFNIFENLENGRKQGEVP